MRASMVRSGGRIYRKQFLTGAMSPGTVSLIHTLTPTGNFRETSHGRVLTAAAPPKRPQPLRTKPLAESHIYPNGRYTTVRAKGSIPDSPCEGCVGYHNRREETHLRDGRAWRDHPLSEEVIIDPLVTTQLTLGLFGGSRPDLRHPRALSGGYANRRRPRTPLPARRPTHYDPP